ncbi:unnamed protein product [Phaeothamnion confervicola]
MPAWVVLIVFPRWERRRQLVQATVLLYCALYAALMWNDVARGGVGGLKKTMEQFSTLSGVRSLLASQAATLPAWFHYVAFDLFVGQNILEENLRTNALPQPMVAVVLVFSMLFGPTGLLLYFLLSRANAEISKQKTR